ncbi:MAG: PAS domain-containing protein [Spirochaetaceae bacterium]|nr:PAS domain-containing protein [Spirochaetaceae bacterium]
MPEKARTNDLLEYTRNLIESAPVGIATFDASGQCLSANGAAARIQGATLEQLLSQNFMALGPWEASGLLDAAKKTMATGRGHRLDIGPAAFPGAPVRVINQFESFVCGGRRYLLQILTDIPFF